MALPEISGGAALSLFESLPRHQWAISFIAHEGKVSFGCCRPYKPTRRLSLRRSRILRLGAAHPDLADTLLGLGELDAVPGAQRLVQRRVPLELPPQAGEE